MNQNLKNDKKKNREEKTPFNPNQEKITIMPTMIDDSDQPISKRRDLSAIIPKFNDLSQNSDAIEIISKDNALKTDGAMTIANIDANGEYIYRTNFSYPPQIDIEARKEEMEKAKNRKKKKNNKPSKEAQRFQNRTALGSLIAIIILVICFYIYKNLPTEKDFQPLEVVVELGDKLPIRTKAYVKPGIGKDVDELQYILDTSKVELEKVGEYEFTVTYKDITKTGIVKIVDTTDPEVEIRSVFIKEGTEYNANSFILNCHDYSGCNYSFQDSDTPNKYKTPGAYVVYILVTDAHENSVTKKASLIIEAQGNTRTYEREKNFDFNTGYSITETYELYFDEYETYSLLLEGIYTQKFTYQDEAKYTEARKEYSGEINYTCSDSDLTITQIKKVSVIGSNYSQLSDIENYFAREGFNQID